LVEGHLEQSRLAEHAFEDDNSVVWDQAKIPQIATNHVQRKYGESAHMSRLKNPISQPSVESLPIWFPLISKEFVK
jgi:hypothetical protein